MLEELHVRDLAIISEAWVELGPGLNVLTGETGAGKTVLVEALQLLLGERADTGMVRSGAEEAVVEGRIRVDGAERAVRRRLSAQGRSKAYLDGEMATAGALSEAIGPIVDLHGQHDHQALLRPQAHLGYLLRYAGDDASDTYQGYVSAYDARSRAAAAVEEIESSMADARARRDELARVIEEIDSVGPERDEDERLQAVLPRLRHGERLALAASAAHRALSRDGGGSETLSEAVAALRPVEGIDPELDAMVADLASALSLADDVTGRVRRYGESVEYEPSALDETESRLAALERLKRAFGPAMDDVIGSRERAAAELSLLDSGDDRLEAARLADRESAVALDEAVQSLMTALQGTTPGFVSELAEACKDLAMGPAAFDVRVERLDEEAWTAESPLAVQILFSANSGEEVRPLSKIASGGELSRVMLALKGVFGAADATPVLVFDEIDAGIGGSTALAVGRRLAKLAQDHQVLVITHLAQVAAYADHHLLVSKKEQDGRSVTVVESVSGAARESELARMLSGQDSDAALAHVRELLDSVAVGCESG